MLVCCGLVVCVLRLRFDVFGVCGLRLLFGVVWLSAVMLVMLIWFTLYLELKCLDCWLFVGCWCLVVWCLLVLFARPVV